MATGRSVPLRLLSLAALLPALPSCHNKPIEKPNILLICVDDLRPELGCYGSGYIHSPNLDKLASQGIRFNNHYANVPTCGASRYNLITGLFPRNRVQVGNEAIRQTISERATENAIPESFMHQLRNNGWYTMGIGKISHYSDGYLYGYNAPQGTQRELPQSWDEWMLETGKWDSGWKAFFGYANGTDRNSMKNQVKPYECAEVEDNAYPDGLMADRVIKRLAAWSSGSPESQKPFLMAVGFFRPHLPFNAPKKYWDLYNGDSLPLTPVPGLPDSVNLASLHQSTEFNSYRLGDESASLSQPLSDPYARKIRHAYFASISYVDAQIGKVLDELTRLGMDKNTIVIVWGDHGWHLGDLRVWGKHTLFDWALRSTLIMRVPGEDPGLVSNEIVSPVDLYPTLMELTGQEMPYAGDGRSLAPLIRQQNLMPWNGSALSFFNNGVSVRTNRYRLSKYSRDKLPAIELYDHQSDPYESRNVAAKHPDVVDSLMRLPAGEKALKLLGEIYYRGN